MMDQSFQEFQNYSKETFNCEILKATQEKFSPCSDTSNEPLSKWEQSYKTSNMYICPICGKSFLVNNIRTWAYKIKKSNTPVCSYKCMRIHETK